jgi:hypothetical protein
MPCMVPRHAQIMRICKIGHVLIFASFFFLMYFDSKQIDTRVKGEVALLRGKEEYELGDFVLAMDEMSKKMTEDLTGKSYLAGDLRYVYYRLYVVYAFI